jgi:hypothetical protein
MTRAASALFLLGVAAVPIMHPLQVHLFGAEAIPADILFVGSGAAWLVAVLRRQARVRWGPFPIAVAAYLAVVCIAGARSGTTASLDHVVIGLYVCGLALLAYNMVPALMQLDAVAKAWLLGGAIAIALALLGVLLFYAGARHNFAVTGYRGVPAGDYPRIASTFLHPNMLCNYLIVTALLLLAAWEMAWVSTNQLLAGLLATGVAAGFTLSPGLGGLALAVGIWGWLSPRAVRSGRLRRVVLALGVLGATALTVLTFVSLKFGGDGLRPSGRVKLWRQVATGFVHHPLVGRGLGTRLGSVAEGRLTDAHEVWLSVAGHMGLIGLLALVAVVLVAVGRRWRDLANEPIPKALLIAFVGAFLYQGLSMSIEETRHIWLLIGLLAAATQSVRARAPVASES